MHSISRGVSFSATVICGNTRFLRGLTSCDVTIYHSSLSTSLSLSHPSDISLARREPIVSEAQRLVYASGGTYSTDIDLLYILWFFMTYCLPFSVTLGASFLIPPVVFPRSVSLNMFSSQSSGRMIFDSLVLRVNSRYLLMEHLDQWKLAQENQLILQLLEQQLLKLEKQQLGGSGLLSNRILNPPATVDRSRNLTLWGSPMTYGLSRRGLDPEAQQRNGADWRHPWDRTLRTLPKSRMTKQGNFTQRTPQAKKQSDHASRQISKQASGSVNAPYDLVFTAMG
ncbi:hypothetical protein Tco_0544981 [Tanacetum coccineum]